MQASLFLIPVTLGDTDHRRVLPEYNREIILQIKYFIVEIYVLPAVPEKDGTVYCDR